MAKIKRGYEISASSVTGIGPGASFGKYKPENNCGGCNCGCKKEEHLIEPIKVGCYTRIRVGGRVAYTSPNAVAKTVACT